MICRDAGVRCRDSFRAAQRESGVCTTVEIPPARPVPENTVIACLLHNLLPRSCAGLKIESQFIWVSDFEMMYLSEALAIPVTELLPKLDPTKRLGENIEKLRAKRPPRPK